MIKKAGNIVANNALKRILYKILSHIKKNNLSTELISKSSININTAPPKIWEALINPEIAKKYLFGAEIVTDWKEGSSITFIGEFNGNKYQEKGVLLNVKHNIQLQYSHWSNFDGLPDDPKNYRVWTFDIQEIDRTTQLSITEDNIPTEKQKIRSDEFWKEVLQKIKHIVENYPPEWKIGNQTLRTKGIFSA